LKGAVEVGLVPAILAGGTWATVRLLAMGVSAFAVTGLVVGGLAVLLALLERAFPERRDWVSLDQPLATDAAHYLFNYHLGILLGYGASFAVGAALRLPPVWPTSWPLLAQLGLGVFVSEGVSYWQHRAAHRWPWLWRFHALHHRGARLNLVRAGRFHFVDVGTATFLTFVPLVVLGAGEGVIAALSTLTGLLGVVLHANVRVRTPAWLDGIVCTPAVHRLHHGIAFDEGDANFGTTVVVFDRMFGTYRAPLGPTPAATGIAEDRTSTGFLAQVLAPFRAKSAR
jgi:sterol desaturase/sphingolipid hydroxylase (fatty acid hydroxylase superfamily)